MQSEGSSGALPARPVAASPGRTRRQLPHSPPERGGDPVPHTPPIAPRISGPPPKGRPRPPRSPRSRPPRRAPRCGREERGGGSRGSCRPAGGARPLQHMCCHSAVPAVIVAPGRGCAMGPPLLLACLLAPLCARVRDGAGGWGAARWCWGSGGVGGHGALAPIDALSWGWRGWGLGAAWCFSLCMSENSEMGCGGGLKSPHCPFPPPPANGAAGPPTPHCLCGAPQYGFSPEYCEATGALVWALTALGGLPHAGCPPLHCHPLPTCPELPQRGLWVSPISASLLSSADPTAQLCTSL